MDTDQKQKLSRILDIAEGVNSVGDNTLLDGVITYRLGRLGDFTKAPVKLYGQLREKKRKEIFEKQKELKKGLVGANEEQKRDINEQVQKLNEDFTESIDTILDHEESISIPSFKLSDFLAKDEKKTFQTVGKGEDQKLVEVIVKPGQSLVPVRFFSLMGDLVTDDKDALK